MVTAAIALFVIQVGMRFSAYFEYKSNLDVKVNSVETLPFPAITLCNQNNYNYFIYYLKYNITEN